MAINALEFRGFEGDASKPVTVTFQSGRVIGFNDFAHADEMVRYLIRNHDVVWVDWKLVDGSVVKIRKEF
jgi:hypothetical protein